MFKKLLLGVLLLAAPAFGQSLQGAPAPTYFGTSKTTHEPCRVPSYFVDTDATSGQRNFACEAGTFVLQGDGGGVGSGDNVSVNGVAATDPDLRSDGDVDVIRCTGAGAPNAACPAAEDVIYIVKANSIALTTDTTGNYAAGDAEAGNALSGDSATNFFSSGTIELTRGGMGADVSGFGNSVFGLISGTLTDIDTFAELMTAFGISNATLDTNGNLTVNTLLTLDQTTEPGNMWRLSDNDTAFTNDPTCANSGLAGEYRLIDSDETASDRLDVCDGTAVHWRFPTPSTTTSHVLKATATSGVPAFSALVMADLPVEVKTQVCSIPVFADASGTLAHVDLIARCKIPDASTLVRVSCTSGQANGFSIEVVERAETTPNTGTTGMLGGALACDTDNQADTTFSDSAIAADAYLVVDVTAESLAANEHGFIAIEYQVN